MPARRVQKTHLPDWFNLARYDACLTWSVVVWRRVLMNRAFLFQCTDKDWVAALDPDQPIAAPLGGVARILEVLTRTPLEEVELTQSIREERQESRQKIVAPLQLGHVAAIDFQWHCARSGYPDAIATPDEVEAIEGWPEPADGPAIAAESYDERLATKTPSRRSPGYGPSMAHLVVDLCATDDALVEQFRACVAELRGGLNCMSLPLRFTSSDCAKWHEQRLLPYLDLTLWSRATEAKLTHTVIGAALFPDDIDVNVGDRIRRTVRPLAQWLMSSGTLNALDAQCADESQKTA